MMKISAILMPLIAAIAMILFEKPTKQINLVVTYAEIVMWMTAFIFSFTGFIIVTIEKSRSAARHERHYDKFRTCVQILHLLGAFICLTDAVILSIWTQKVFPTMQVNIDMDTLWGFVDICMAVYFIMAGCVITMVYGK